MATKISKPLLSVGIIFKNEIRCLERCLKSFEPLRATVPMEIVTGDTGATDGSREIAEKYADKVIDFPWINDFAAARNAVMEQCHGKWFMFIDADEWLDEDVNGLRRFLKRAKPAPGLGFSIQLRNYTDHEFTVYQDIDQLRIVCPAGVHFEGAIHEHFVYKGGPIKTASLENVHLHHDGYVMLNDGSEAGEKKRERNNTLMDDILAETPDDLRVRMMFMDTGTGRPDFDNFARQSVEYVEQKVNQWQLFGPPVLDRAIRWAAAKNFPELEDWYRLAKEMFPKSYHIRMNVNYTMLTHDWGQKKYDNLVDYCEDYLDAFDHMTGSAEAHQARVLGGLTCEVPMFRQLVSLVLMDAYGHFQEYEKAVPLLDSLDYNAFDVRATTVLLKQLRDYYKNGTVDVTPYVRPFWDGINEPYPSKKRAGERKAAFNQSAVAFFTPAPEEDPDRPAYALLACLKGENDLGDTANILCTRDAPTLSALLAEQKDLTKLTAPVFYHFLEHGARFPIPDKPLPMEVYDALGEKLMVFKDRCVKVALDRLSETFNADWQTLSWMRALALAAVKSFDWKQGDGDTGVKLMRLFAAVENDFLSRCYTADALRDVYILPPLHRYAMYCVRTVSALDAGEFIKAVEALRAGLDAAPTMKDMTQFLLKQMKRLEKERIIENAPPELKALAEKVKAILSAYPADNPAVKEIKESDIYKKVAYLIEN